MNVMLQQGKGRNFSAIVRRKEILRHKWNKALFNSQTPLQLTNQTQLQLVGVGVDFVFLQEGRKEEPPPSF